MTDTIEIELDDAREIMLEELTEEFGEEPIIGTLENAVVKELTGLYDNQDQLRQAQQQQVQQR